MAVRAAAAEVIGLPALYALAALAFGAYAAVNLSERRWGNAAFWGLLALSFAGGDRLGDLGNGVLAVGLAVLAGAGVLRGPRAGNSALPLEDVGGKQAWKLFGPALIIPAVTLAGTLGLKGTGLVDPKQVTLISLGLGVIVALGAAMLWLRPPLSAPAVEGARIIDQVGWAAVLPQMLAALGAVFAAAGVGDVVGEAIGPGVAGGGRLAAVAVYCGGMALMTICLGNAFAAFPVMTAAVGYPILIRGLGGDPAVIGAVGMLAGFCGTLLTPMAANFNIVPAALLGLSDRYGVIRAQAGTALPLLLVNMGVMYFGAWM